MGGALCHEVFNIQSEAEAGRLCKSWVTHREVAMIHCPLWTPPTSAWLTTWLPPVSHLLAIQYTTGASTCRKFEGTIPKDTMNSVTRSTGTEAQHCGGRIQHVVLLSAEIIRQYPPVVAAVVGLVNDLVVAGYVVGSSHDFVQRRKGRQGVSPVERLQGCSGIVGDTGKIIPQRLTRDRFHISGLLDADIGIQALVGHGRLDEFDRQTRSPPQWESYPARKNPQSGIPQFYIGPTAEVWKSLRHSYL